jgi:nucleoside-diphosphate-sugar epimerase
MPERVLVTGARGFIGRHLVSALHQSSVDVVEHSTSQGNIVSCALPYDGVDRVFHLAGRSFVPESWTNTPAFFETNVLGTVNVLEFCRRTGAALTLVSSYVYGQPRSLPIGEDHAVEAANPYAESKILAEESARYYARQFGIRLTIVRPFNIYGPGQDERFLISMLLRQALDPGQDSITVADLSPRRDYLYIDDFIALLLATRTGPAGTYNAGSGVSYSVAEVIATINSFLPRPKPARSRGEPRPNEIPDVRADITVAQSLLGWGPMVELRNGIGMMISALPGPL